MKTKFKDLTWPVKVGVVGGWISAAIYTFSFLLGLLEGILGY